MIHLMLWMASHRNPCLGVIIKLRVHFGGYQDIQKDDLFAIAFAPLQGGCDIYQPFSLQVGLGVCKS